MSQQQPQQFVPQQVFYSSAPYQVGQQQGQPLAYISQPQFSQEQPQQIFPQPYYQPTQYFKSPKKKCIKAAWWNCYDAEDSDKEEVDTFQPVRYVYPQQQQFQGDVQPVFQSVPFEQQLKKEQDEVQKAQNEPILIQQPQVYYSQAPQFQSFIPGQLSQSYTQFYPQQFVEPIRKGSHLSYKI